ncbi:hypothetical protein [Crocosphaera chwakensis]|uniref:Uncharacterized protein n=1 Tax=Crocosphaera chwakensis CCY0110 TaxID=391612 RepID=A3IZ59_9CHRO|nr:hypothetical protein [Crocosphaera chwakensis]EAZ88229.1 hypothetical protein CY0110_01235 [Crocosphaera chwakensis CCY0110]
MESLTPSQIADIVVAFWDTNSFLESHKQNGMVTTPKELSLILQLGKTEVTNKENIAFFEALKIFIINYLSKENSVPDYISFRVDYSPEKAFDLVESEFNVKAPLNLPIKSTLNIAKKDMGVVVIEKKAGYEAEWTEESYQLKIC